MIAYFVGVKPGDRAGHFCYKPGYQKVWLSRDSVQLSKDGEPSPWAGVYPLGDSEATEAAWPDWETPVEGNGHSIRTKGWTLLSFWDRSGDKRPGSHASFAFDVDVGAEEVLGLAREHFPEIITRMETYLGEPLKVRGI